jgi:hypothetical protein
MKNKFLYILLGLFCFVGGSYAQRDDTLKTDEVYIYREYEPTVSDAFKISSFPSIEDKVIDAPQIKYSTIKKQVPTSFSIEPIKPARMKGDRLTKLSKAYIKAGVGNYTNNMFEAYVNNSRSRKHAVGLHVKHLGSNGGIDDFGYNGFAKQNATVYGKKFLRQHLVEGDVNFDREVVRYYGYPNPDISTAIPKWYDGFEKSNTKQRFSKVGANGSVKSFYKDSAKVNYDIDLNYYNLTDRFGVMENYAVISGQFVKIFSPEWSDFVNNEVLMLDAYLDYNRYSWADSSFLYTGTEGAATNGIFKLTPQISSSGTKWRLDIGMNMNVNAGSTAQFHFYPKVHLKYNILKDMLIPYVGVDGGLQRNNFGSFSDVNPFVRSEIIVANTNKKYDFYGGVRGAFSSKIGFNLRASRAMYENMPLFVNHDLKGLTFDVVYDTVAVTKLGGEISYHNADKLNIIFKGNYSIYDLKNESAPWHLPNLRVGMIGHYDLKDKIIVKADVFYNSGQAVRTFDPADEDLGGGVYKKTLNGYLDASFGVEYRYTKKLSIFLNVNNVASTKYYKWSNYPSQSVNVLGGLKYSFWE